MKHLLLALCLLPMAAAAQSVLSFNEAKASTKTTLQGAITTGTTGIGIDLAMPISDVVRLRTGFTYMPKFHYHMAFGVDVSDNGQPDQPSADGKPVIRSKFQLVSDMMEQMFGVPLDDQIDMIGEPTMSNFKLLVDLFPFRNKHWHLTAGFYWGPAKMAKAYNAEYENASLAAINTYNAMSRKMIYAYENDLPWFTYVDKYGDVTMEPMVDPAMAKKMASLGNIGMSLGYTTDADGNKVRYMAEPNADNMMKAKMKTNSFKPYLGAGYEGRLLKKDPTLTIGVEAGVLFWGGAPEIIMDDGTNLSKDVEEIPGKVGDYVDFFNKVKVFPVVNLRIAKRIF